MRSKKRNTELPKIYGLPKMHKTTPKLRYIVASCKSTIKGVDKLMTKCLAEVYKYMRNYCNTILERTKHNRMWILDNSMQLKEHLSQLNGGSKANTVTTWDFSTLYTTIPHVKLKTKIKSLVKFVLEKSGKDFFCANPRKAFLSCKEYKGYSTINLAVAKYYLDFLIDNIYVEFGNTLHKQTIGIPMGMCCAPLLANLFLMSYEYEFIEKMEKDKNPDVELFSSTFRYIDDLISLNNGVFEKYLDKIYPPELSITKETKSDKEASYLDIFITIKDDKFHTKLYDKRDDFNFKIVNYPHPIASNIPEKPAYGVYASRIICFARACDEYTDFSERHKMLCETLLKQGYRYNLLCKQLRSTYSRHKTLFQKYNKSVEDIKEEVPLPVLVKRTPYITTRS